MVSKMVRTICCEKTGLKRGAWTAEEDRKLTAYIKRYGHWNWRELPKYAGLARCGKSCRLRWMNYLRPNIKRGNYSTEEEEIIINLHESLGNKWAAIALKLPGRTDNEIKNHWHTNLKKRMKQNSTTSEPKLHPNESSKIEANTKKESEPSSFLPNAQTHQILESSLLSPQLSSSSSLDFSSMLTDSPVEASTNWVADENKSSLAKFAEPVGDFWTEPYLAGNSYVQEDYPETLMDPRFVFSPSFVSLEEPLCAYIDDDMDWLYQSMQEELPKF